MAKTVLKIEKLKKTFIYGQKEVQVVKGVDLEVNEGEIICLFGRSGSGKTTLLNLIGGLDQPDSGKIIINNKDISFVSAREMPEFRRKNLGFVFQYFNLIPYLTTLENVVLPLKFHGIEKKERETKGKEILHSLGMSERMNFRMANLSGGQIQRTAFARAVIMNPSLVLADEPTGQLDTQTANELAELISHLNREKTLTFIIATHDEVFKSIAHRILNIEDGLVCEV
ncbi:MAG: ABC transporter ATP-binding protein [Vulcanimicrobiota bacterium]